MFSRHIVNYFCRIVQKQCKEPTLRNRKLQQSCPISRGFRSYQWPYSRELYARRLKEGPIKDRHRSERLNWNYDVELYAFTNRISEELSSRGVAKACTDVSYSIEVQQLLDDGSIGSNNQLTADSNQALAASGRDFAGRYICDYMKRSLPNLPADGIQAVMSFLLTDEKLSHIGRHIGLDDLTMCNVYPIPDDMIAKSLSALIGLIIGEKGEKRAAMFVRDFIISQLVGEDIDEIYPLNDAMNRLESLLTSSGLAEPEPRLLGQLGQEAYTSCYYVGIYSNKELIGRAPGETREIAEEMAARDALMNVYGIQDNRLPLDFSSSEL